MIKITYIHHDCFLVQTPQASLLFDYYLDPTTGTDADPEFLKFIDRQLPFYVFVSHHHKDHLSKEIFTWAGQFPKIHYILSRDVARFCRHILSPTSVYNGPKVPMSMVSVLRPGNTYTPPGMRVRAFGSTDIGNSYMVEIAGSTIFHAGDLNAWIWKDESTPKEVSDAIAAFKAILNDIAKWGYLDIDFCFFPVDSRIGSEYWTGARIFLEKFHVAHFFPMHFGLGDELEQRRRRIDASEFRHYANPYFPTEFIGPLAPYGSFIAPGGADPREF